MDGRSIVSKLTDPHHPTVAASVRRHLNFNLSGSVAHTRGAAGAGDQPRGSARSKRGDQP